VEKASVDPKNGKMVLKAQNISYSSIIKMKETCVYTRHPENLNWTKFHQEASVSAFVSGISNKVENICVGIFRRNAAKGREIMEQAVNKVKVEAEEAQRQLENAASRLKQEAEDFVRSTSGSSKSLHHLD
jgi:hypothetical protein